jgi:hypothetical protein
VSPGRVVQPVPSPFAVGRRNCWAIDMARFEMKNWMAVGIEADGKIARSNELYFFKMNDQGANFVASQPPVHLAATPIAVKFVTVLDKQLFCVVLVDSYDVSIKRLKPSYHERLQGSVSHQDDLRSSLHSRNLFIINPKLFK